MSLECAQIECVRLYQEWQGKVDVCTAFLQVVQIHVGVLSCEA